MLAACPIKLVWSSSTDHLSVDEKHCYVGHYMLGRQYWKDFGMVVFEALAYAQGLKPAGDGKDIWVFDVDEPSLSNLLYFAKHGFR